MAKAPLARLLDLVDWQETPPPPPSDDPTPYTTHEGVLTIPGFGTMRVYQLNTGERIIDGEDFVRIFDDDTHGGMA